MARSTLFLGSRWLGAVEVTAAHERARGCAAADEPNRALSTRKPRRLALPRPGKIDNGAGGSRATWTGKPARVCERGRKQINRGALSPRLQRKANCARQFF